MAKPAPKKQGQRKKDVAVQKNMDSLAKQIEKSERALLKSLQAKYRRR